MASDSEENVGSPIDFPGPQMPTRLGPFVKLGAVLVGLILLFVLLSFLRAIYTDLLWFGAVDFRSVYVKILVTRIVLFVIGAALIMAVLGVSLYVCNRVSRGQVNLPLPPETVDLLKRLTFWGTVAVVAVVGIIFGAIFASHWETFLRLVNDVQFGQVDPVYNKDISFYVFRMPAYTFVQGWLLGAAIVVLIATLALYFVNFNLRGVSIDISTGLKVHVSVIGALLIFVVAWGHWLDRWELVLSGQGAVFGAAYTDIHARKIALLILTIIAVASGVLMLVNAYLRGIRLLAGAFALWIVMGIGLGFLWPAAMQQFSVSPNEFAREEPFILRNIDFTRRGFGLNRIEDAFYPVQTSVTAELIAQNRQTVNNIRLWDHRPLSDVYTQIQLIRPYYDFRRVDVDRYTLDGEYRQVMLAVREVAPEKLETAAQTWVNEKLVYTHGIGLAMSPVTEFTPEGRPEFFAKDIPADGVIPIRPVGSLDEPDILVSNPRVYYGENTLDYVVVNTNTEELDYQTEEAGLVRTRYTGDGGVNVGSFIRQLAYAWQFGDINILISGEITGDSMIQYRRQIQERISAVTPFLMLDQDPYIVAAEVEGEGRLFWVQDAYTTSNSFPYSDRFTDLESSFNYIRNSVKITVDSFDGNMTFYIWDETDPVIRVHEKIFPSLFVSKDQMPETLREHVRYPQDLFTQQASKYIKYHMDDPQDFYNSEDLWAVPLEKLGQTDNLQPVEPYYVIMKLPGEEREEFVQLFPYTPSQRQNLVGWLAARSDGDNYGQIVAFNFPKDRQVDGPEQVEARIDNDADISAWFTLRCTQGSICIRGNLLVIPIGDSILYAEPVFIQAEGVRFPELKRVILATGEKVVMEESLEEALTALTGAPSSALGQAAGDGQPVTQPPPDGVAPPAITGGVQAEIETLIEAIDLIRQEFSRLEQVLERLQELTSGE